MADEGACHRHDQSDRRRETGQGGIGAADEHRLSSRCEYLTRCEY
jgi:hypothetical protein